MYLLFGLLHAIPILFIGFFAKKQSTVTVTSVVMSIVAVLSGNPMFIAIDMLFIGVAWYAMNDYVKNKPLEVIDPEVERLRAITEEEKQRKEKIQSKKDFRTFLKVIASIVVIGGVANVWNYYSGPMHEINERKAKELENWSNLDSPMWIPDFMMAPSWDIDNMFLPRYDLQACHQANSLMDTGKYVTEPRENKRKYTLQELVDTCKEQAGKDLTRTRLLGTKACHTRQEHLRFEAICNQWESLYDQFVQWSTLVEQTEQRYQKNQ